MEERPKFLNYDKLMDILKDKDHMVFKSLCSLLREPDINLENSDPLRYMSYFAQHILFCQNEFTNPATEEVVFCHFINNIYLLSEKAKIIQWNYLGCIVSLFRLFFNFDVFSESGKAFYPSLMTFLKRNEQ